MALILQAITPALRKVLPRETISLYIELNNVARQCQLHYTFKNVLSTVWKLKKRMAGSMDMLIA